MKYNPGCHKDYNGRGSSQDSVENSPYGPVSELKRCSGTNGLLRSYRHVQHR